MLMAPYCGAKPYDPKDMIYLKNPEQSSRFAKYAYLYDVFLSGDRLTYVFKKIEVEDLLSMWRDHTLV